MGKWNETMLSKWNEIMLHMYILPDMQCVRHTGPHVHTHTHTHTPHTHTPHIHTHTHTHTHSTHTYAHTHTHSTHTYAHTHTHTHTHRIIFSVVVVVAVCCSSAVTTPTFYNLKFMPRNGSGSGAGHSFSRHATWEMYNMHAGVNKPLLII